MMRCKGDTTKGFHKLRMMIYFHHSEKGNHFACPECGRVAIAPVRAPPNSKRGNNITPS